MLRERKVQGAQWYVTLPKEWRNGHSIKRGGTLNAHFNPTSVLIFNPKGRAMSPIERNLVDVLIGLPQLVNTKELVDTLRALLEQLDETV